MNVTLLLRTEIASRVAEILKVEMKDYSDDQVLHEIRGWDSIRFMRLLMSIEKAWQVSFEAHEVARVSTWGHLITLIKAKKN